MAKRIWRERDHPRDNRGRFAERGGSNWITRVSKQFEGSFGDTSAGAGGTDPRLGGRLQTGKGSLLDIAGMSKAAKAKYPRKADGSRNGMAGAIRDAANAYRSKSSQGELNAETTYRQRLADRLNSLAGRVESGDTSAEEARAELGRMGRSMAGLPYKNLSNKALVDAQKALRDGERSDLGLDRPAPPGAKLPVPTRNASQRVPLKNLDKRTDQEIADMVEQRSREDTPSNRADVAQLEAEQARRRTEVGSTDSFVERMSAQAGLSRGAQDDNTPQWGTMKSAGVKGGDLVMWHGSDRATPKEGTLARIEGDGSFYRLVDPETGDRIATWGGVAAKGWLSKAPDTSLDTKRAGDYTGGMTATTADIPPGSARNFDSIPDEELRNMQRVLLKQNSPKGDRGYDQIQQELDRRSRARSMANANAVGGLGQGLPAALEDRPFKGDTITDETPVALRSLRDQVYDANTKKEATAILRNADQTQVGQLADHLGVARTRAAVVDAIRNPGQTPTATKPGPQDLTPAMQGMMDRLKRGGGSISFRLNSNSRRFASVSPSDRVVLQGLERRGLVRNTGTGIDFKYELVEGGAGVPNPPAADVAAHTRPKPATGVVLPGKKVTIKGTPEGIQIRDAGATDYKGDKVYTLFDAKGNEVGTLQKVTRTSAVKVPGSRIASGFRKSSEWEATVKGGTTSRERGTGYTAAQALERMPTREQIDAARARRREQEQYTVLAPTSRIRSQETPSRTEVTQAVNASGRTSYADALAELERARNENSNAPTLADRQAEIARREQQYQQIRPLVERAQQALRRENPGLNENEYAVLESFTGLSMHESKTLARNENLSAKAWAALTPKQRDDYELYLQDVRAEDDYYSGDATRTLARISQLKAQTGQQQQTRTAPATPRESFSADELTQALNRTTQDAMRSDAAKQEHSDLFNDYGPQVAKVAQKLLDNWLKGLMTDDEFQREMQVERVKAQGKA